jgi:hypothetical protein
VSADAVLLMTARLLPQFAGAGLGRMLVQAVVREAARRGIRAVEAFGRSSPVEPDAAPQRGGPGREHECLLPAEYLLAVGFKTVRAHPRTPRLRLDVKSTVSWREDVEYAFDRLLTGLQSPAFARR